MLGVRRWALGVPGDGADERRRAAGQNPAAEVFLGERSQRCPLHHHQDRGVPARPGGTSQNVHQWRFCLLTGPQRSIFSHNSGIWTLIMTKYDPNCAAVLTFDFADIEQIHGQTWMETKQESCLPIII